MPRVCAWLKPASRVTGPVADLAFVRPVDPLRIFIKVDLPAPFSPHSAWISPARRSRLTPESATTLAKRLVRPETLSKGGASGAAEAGTDSRLVKPLWSCHCASFGFGPTSAYPIAQSPQNHGATARILGHSGILVRPDAIWSGQFCRTAHVHPLAPRPRRPYQQIADRIRTLIGTPPSRPARACRRERELAQQLGVSRPSLREALIALEIDRRIEIRGGSGVYVCEPLATSQGRATSALGESPAELMQARAALEGAVITLAAARVTPAGLQRLQDAPAMRDDVQQVCPRCRRTGASTSPWPR